MQPEEANAPQHDAFTRLLHRLEPDAQALWEEAKAQVERSRGLLVVDDSTLDKPYAQKMALVQRHGSGKHHDAVVEGINLITLLWSEGDRHVPLDYRIYDKAGDALTKNDHFRTLLETAHARKFRPECVVFDSWYSRLENLKQIRGDCKYPVNQVLSQHTAVLIFCEILWEKAMNKAQITLSDADRSYLVALLKKGHLGVKQYKRATGLLELDRGAGQSRYGVAGLD